MPYNRCLNILVNCEMYQLIKAHKNNVELTKPLRQMYVYMCNRRKTENAQFSRVRMNHEQKIGSEVQMKDLS